LNCPRDAAELEVKSFGTTAVQTCPVCAGMFLAHGQLNQVAGPIRGDLEFSIVDLDSFQHEDAYGPITCPNDGAAMGKVDFGPEMPSRAANEPIDFSNDPTIILDYCRRCLGFWMDGKELTRIHEEVKRLNEADAEVPDPLLVRISQFFWNLPLPH
jgi:Zn-finger nucleic acid-binding protein